jgi:hypothetical protein
MVLGNLYLMIMKALFSLPLSLLLPLVPLPALAEDKCKEEISWEESGEVIICPLTRWGWGTVPGIPWTVPEDVLLVIFPPQPALHFSGAQGDGGSVAKATLAFPPISVGEQAIFSPFLALNGQDEGTSQGLTLAVEGGLQLSLGQLSLQLSAQRTIRRPFSFTTFTANASFEF